MKILIGTPTANGDVTTTYALSLFHLTAKILTERPDIRLYPPRFLNGAVVSHARNALASVVLEDPSITHLLFIDSDMGFGPEAVLRLIDFDKDLCASICPKRTQAPGEPMQFVGVGGLVRSAQGYVVDRGFVRASYVGAGLTLVRRNVFERLRDHFPELCVPANESYRSLGVQREVFQCFETVKSEDGYYLSEDFSFCTRWQAVGGEMWAMIDEPIIHVGVTPVQGRLVDQAVRNDPSPAQAAGG